jgi:hypothetical protein
MNALAAALALVNVQSALFRKEALILKLTKQPVLIAVLVKAHVRQETARIFFFHSMPFHQK